MGLLVLVGDGRERVSRQACGDDAVLTGVGLVQCLMRGHLGCRYLGLRPVVLWSLLLQPGGDRLPEWYLRTLDP